LVKSFVFEQRQIGKIPADNDSGIRVVTQQLGEDECPVSCSADESAAFGRIDGTSVAVDVNSRGRNATSVRLMSVIPLDCLSVFPAPFIM
jgi:hypothetical protein